MKKVIRRGSFKKGKNSKSTMKKKIYSKSSEVKFKLNKTVLKEIDQYVPPTTFEGATKALS